ncbi:MAG: hypothetical protein GEV09_15865 [Pseudonocardiaceae bacterium]|nr:hypothetical protein [Pseudonocardiaceae bacterium]
MTLEHMGVVPEVWPVAADELGIWLLSGRDAWRGDRIPADSEPHFEVEGLLYAHRVERAALLHSTSWRPDGPHVVLTYMAVIGVNELVRDEWPAALPVSAELLPHVGNPFPHGPTEVPVARDIDVLHHGLRHLRFLLDTDSSARDALTRWWKEHLSQLTPTLAGMYEAGQNPGELKL